MLDKAILYKLRSVKIMKNLIRRKCGGILLSVLLALSLGLSGCAAGAAIQPVTISASKAEDILQKVPAYQNAAYVTVNDNVPFFTESDFTTEAFERYSDLDSLGRCGAAFANVCPEIMPTEERGSIGMVKPSGWHTVKYDGIDGNYLYNRCHLIGYQLSGENANEKNLITGTRYLNVQGMLPFENQVADYVKSTGNHVLYRSTPLFEGSDLVARGVLLEAASVEDEGKGIQFNVFCYNVQPGVTIQYADGSSSGPAFTGSEKTAAKQTETGTEKTDGSVSSSTDAAYIGNANSKKFHRSSCSSVKDMAEKNKVKLESREEALAEGYQACGICKP